MPPSPEEVPQRYVKALIYGQAGAGKTRFCADAPKPWWYDFEDSTETLLHWPEYEHIAKERTTRHPEVTRMFRQILQAERDPEIETVVIDTMTSALASFVEDYVAKQTRKDEYMRYDSDYGYATNVFSRILTQLQRVKLNVVIIGHERFSFSNDREHEVEKIFPDVTPRLRQAVTRLVNVVGYMEAPPGKSAKRKLYLNPTLKIEAKNRLNFQDTFIENPTWESVFGNAN